MKIVVCPSDETACGKYRLIWPAEALKAQGHSITIQRRPRILVSQAYTPPKVIDVMVPEGTTTIVFQRPASYQISQIIPLLHERGIRVVVDLDDDFQTLHRMNPAYDYYKEDSHRNWKWMKKSCEMADVVTATTEALLEKYSKNNGVLIPNCIPERFLNIEKKPNEVVTVGWAGRVRTHPEDLQITHGAVNDALSKQNARFMAIGDIDMFNKLQIRNRLPHVYQPGVEFDEYPEVLAKLDIGIVPLADSEFNRCKSWLKALEYASLGVAPIVSPTPDNMKLVDAGGAYVARSPKAWKDAVRTLITKTDQREDLVQRARAIATNWTIEKNGWRWKEAWGIV